MTRKAAIALILPVLAFALLYQYFRMLHITNKLQTPTTDNNVASPTATSDVQQPTQQEPHQRRGRRKISLVVRMKGEMANLLSHLVFAKGIQLWVEDHYGHNLTLELIGERQSGTKWKGAVKDLQACFPHLRPIEFQGGRWDNDFQIRKEQQRQWVGDENHRGKLLIDRGDSDCGSEEMFCLYDQLAFLQSLLLQQEQGKYNHVVDNNITQQSPQRDDEAKSNNRYSLPFLVTNRLASFDVLVDQYFDEIKEWLSFDYGSCCSSVQPSPDEIVLHLRNFRAEMRERNYLERGYEELSPKRMAQDLLGHLPTGSKVAIASRGEAYVDLYVKALRERGFQVRTTPSNHSGVQDFCFLLRTQRELLGTMRSTYTRWAALLGQAQRVQLYSMDSPSIRMAQGSDTFAEDIHYQWKRPELKAKFGYHIFTSNGTL